MSNSDSESVNALFGGAKRRVRRASKKASRKTSKKSSRRVSKKSSRGKMEVDMWGGKRRASKKVSRKGSKGKLEGGKRRSSKKGSKGKLESGKKMAREMNPKMKAALEIAKVLKSELALKGGPAAMKTSFALLDKHGDGAIKYVKGNGSAVKKMYDDAQKEMDKNRAAKKAAKSSS
jgi:hypothetical protein